MKAPSTWKLAVNESEDKQIYTNSKSRSNERVVLQVDTLTEREAAFQPRLAEQKAKFSQFRAELFASAGLGGYLTLEIQNRKKRMNEFESLTVIQSRYTDFKKRSVQMIERQYLAGTKLFTVIYLVDSPSLNDREHVEQVMNDFVPVLLRNGRSPASAETVTADQSSVGDKAAASTMMDSARQPVADLDMSDRANVQRCEAFCKDDESKCRKAGTAGFLDEMNLPKQVGSCFKGLGQGVWGMGEGIWNVAKFGWNYAKSWAIGDDYKTQVHAAVGAIASELYKDPAALTARVGAALWNSASRALGDYFICASPAEQWRQICLVGTNFIPFGLVVKLAAKGAMTAAEIAKVAEAFSLEKALVRKVEAPTGQIKNADGDVVYNLGGGKSAVVNPDATKIDVAAKPAAEVAETASAIAESAKRRPTAVRTNDPRVQITKDPNFSAKTRKAGSYLAWQSEVELAPLLQKMTLDQRSRIDGTLRSAIDSKEMLSQLEAIAKRGNSDMLSAAMAQYKVTGNEKVDSAWLKAKIAELSRANRVEAHFGEQPKYNQTIATREVVPEASNHNRDPDFVPQITRSPGTAEVEWSGIRDRIQRVAAEHGIGDVKDLTASVYINGVEVKKGIPWEQTKVKVPESKNGQVDYYVVYKRGDQIVDISKWSMRETKDMKTLADGSFTGKFAGENFSVKLSEDLKAKGMSEELTETAVRLGNKKVVWNLKADADPEVKKFVAHAADGVDVKAEIGRDGDPERVTIRNRKTGELMNANPKDLHLKGDAAFSGNQFFWDDMWVAGGSVEHNPKLARATIESWLDAHDLTNGPIPREVRKENGRSLWFEETVRFPEGPKANLTYTNPYLINWAADKLYRYNPTKDNLELLKRVSKSVDKYTQWMEDPKSQRAIRDADGKIIGFNGSALGTGLDNSRLNVGNSNELAGHKRGFVDFLSQQIAMLKDNAQWQLLFARDAQTADEKEQYVAKARELQKKAMDYTKTLNDKYWDPNKKFYFDITPDQTGRYAQDQVTTPVSGFWPLFAKAADRGKVNEMVEKQMVPEKFGGEAPMPSNSRDSVTWKDRPMEYEPRRNEKGEVIDDGYHDAAALWNPNATMAAQGLRRSGRPDVAHAVSRDFTARMADSSTKTVEEAYGTDKVVQADGTVKFVGRPLAHAKHPHREDFAGWGKVPPIDGTVQDAIGINPTAKNGIEWNLRTPLKVGSKTDSLGVFNLQYGGGNIKQLEIKRTGQNTYEVTVESEKSFDLRVGSLLDSKDALSAKPQGQGQLLHVEGGSKKQVIRVDLKPVDWNSPTGVARPSSPQPPQSVPAASGF